MRCDGDCPRCLDLTKPQPHGDETRFGGIFIKEMRLDHAGMPVFAHAHEYDHVSYLACGSVRVWIQGQNARDYVAPAAINISAKLRHEFLSLEDGTLVLCIHSVGKMHGPPVHELYPVDSIEVRTA